MYNVQNKQVPNKTGRRSAGDGLSFALSTLLIAATVITLLFMGALGSWPGKYTMILLISNILLAILCTVITWARVGPAIFRYLLVVYMFVHVFFLTAMYFHTYAERLDYNSEGISTFSTANVGFTMFTPSQAPNDLIISEPFASETEAIGVKHNLDRKSESNHNYSLGIILQTPITKNNKDKKCSYSLPRESVGECRLVGKTDSGKPVYSILEKSGSTTKVWSIQLGDSALDIVNYSYGRPQGVEKKLVDVTDEEALAIINSLVPYTED